MVDIRMMRSLIGTIRLIDLDRLNQSSSDNMMGAFPNLLPIERSAGYDVRGDKDAITKKAKTSFSPFKARAGY